jgi:hypothetical protein
MRLLLASLAHQKPMNPNNPIQMSQGYEVLPPKSSKAYPIPCDEWDLLKVKIASLATPPSFFSNIGSILVGASLSTFITIVSGTFSDPSKQRELIIAWAVVVVCFVCGVLCYLFSHMQQKMRQVQAGEITAQMEIIERRYKNES